MIMTLTGSNSFSLQRELTRLIDLFVREQGELALERIDGSEAQLSTIREAITSLPFLAAKKLVILRSPSSNIQFIEQIAQLLADTAPSTDLIIHEPKLDKRSGYYKFLKKETDYREHAELDVNGLAAWLIREVKEREGLIRSNDARYLVERVGTNQQLLSNEIEKLTLYAPTVTRATIDKLTEATPQTTIFQLLEAAFSGNAQRAFALYHDQRALKVEPIQIIAMLTWQLHILAIVKASGDRNPAEIASQAKLSPYVVQKSSGIANRLTLGELRGLIAQLLVLDKRSKSQQIDIDEALQQYILMVTRLH
jgi:DNA polymerase-3 subunit delta